MAEFKEVMKEAKRMCGRGCYGCAFKDNEIVCAFLCNLYNDKILPSAFEETVMKWASEHPVKRYPTWKEWIKTITIRVGAITAIPCHFIECEICNCSAHSCPRLDEEIPEDFAVKANIQPLEEEKTEKKGGFTFD